MIVNSLDLGSHSPLKVTTTTFHTGLVSIPGGYAIHYGLEGDPDAWGIRIWVQPPNAVGQFASKTQAAMEFLMQQLKELVRNPDQQPLYLQFYAGTGTVALSPNYNFPEDGWYYVSQLAVNKSKLFAGFAVVDFNIHSVSPGPPRRIGMWRSGGALTTTGYNVASYDWAAFPFNSVLGLTADATRTGGEGGIQFQKSNLLNPHPFVLSATISDWFKGGCHVYDAMAVIGTNPVPAAPTFLNTNWIEVFGIDHRFVGDVVVTNGLHLVTLSAAASPGVVCYLWNTALGTPGWQQYSSLNYQDNAANAGTLRQVSLTRVGLDEVAVQLIATTSVAMSKQTLRSQRGAYAIRLDSDPLSQANTGSLGLFLSAPATPKFVYNSTNLVDNPISGPIAVGAAPDYGYGAFFAANGTYPFVAGWVYQNAPAGQPYANGNASIGVGDTSGPAQNATRSYGIFAIPIATPQNMQAEAEANLTAPWVTTADGAASGGNTSKLPSASTATNQAFGTSFQPTAGSYRGWFRLKVTSIASSTAQLKIGVYNQTGAAYSAANLTIAPNTAGISTSLVWFTVGTFTTNGTNQYNFAVQTTATTDTDWFIDEACMVPYSSATFGFPGDLWQQFAFDRTTKQVVD